VAELTFSIEAACVSVAARGASVLKGEMGLEYLSQAFDYVRDKVA
jgi:hypothetical protein